MITHEQFTQIINILIDEAGLPSTEANVEMVESMFFDFVENTSEQSYPKEFMFRSDLGTGVKLKQRASDTSLYVGAYPEGQTREQAERMIAVSNQVSAVFGDRT